MSCTTFKKLKQGNTLSLKAGFSDNSVISADWNCYLQVRHKPTKTLTSISRTVSTKSVDETRFITTLTASETNSLAKGCYVVGIELENTVTGEVIENTLEIEIIDQWVIR